MLEGSYGMSFSLCLKKQNGTRLFRQSVFYYIKQFCVRLSILSIGNAYKEEAEQKTEAERIQCLWLCQKERGGGGILEPLLKCDPAQGKDALRKDSICWNSGTL